MTRQKFRWLGVGLLASGCAGLLEAASMLDAACAFGSDDTALILGYALTPTPAQSYETEVMNLFINPSSPAFAGQPVFSGYNPLIQSTPETDYQQGLTTGVANLDQGIAQQLTQGDVVVFGYSQSSSVATQELVNLDALPAGQQPNPADLQFVLVEDINNPNGGIFERFPSAIPSLNFPATPADTPYPTDIYTIEYSGVSDFPQYSSNLLADANAAAGYVFLHPFLLPDYPTTFSPSELAGAVPEPVSSGYDGATEYFMIPTQNLPLLDPLRAIPVVGPPLADLVQPDLRVLVDMGYDRSAPADVVTPADWSTPSIDQTTLNAELATGAQQGWTAAMVDLGLSPKSDLPTAYPYVPDLSGLESASSAASASALPDAVTPSTLLEELSGSSLTALLDSSSTADLTSLLSGDLLPGLSALFANPLDLLAF